MNATKLLTLLLALMMVASMLLACAQPTDTPDDTPDAPDTPNTPQAPDGTDDEDVEKPFNIREAVEALPECSFAGEEFLIAASSTYENTFTIDQFPTVEDKTGALVVETGKYTGRSPDDRFVVDVPSIHDEIDWGKVNVPISPEKFEAMSKTLFEAGYRFVTADELK